MNQYAIIVAGGRGLRMGTNLPKQFLPIGGRPVLMHTLESFVRAIPDIHLILVLPADQQTLWHDLCRQHHFTLPHSIVDGGETRFHSVLNGLRTIPADIIEAVVGVHDGVRPFASPDVINRCYAAAIHQEAVVPVVPVVETVRQLCRDNREDEDGQTKMADSQSEHLLSIVSAASATNAPQTTASVTIDRSRLRLVQTPQTFTLPLLRQAYKQPYRDAFTDDASVVEALGHPVALVEGNRENIKITTPFDLTIAEALLAMQH
ncbi:MAG: 2-C-methyl-D-erythritol 4-phosphate cytidylyltransferase [Bacteroidales bacterium]|nr:2-C-methyl-D-erythritol 4-phosphate cytidylyltransferase [Bacteroidales bacterium]